jgi:hypothetical protein
VITVSNASGTCSISASKAGDNNYNGPVTDGPKTVTTAKKQLTVTSDNKSMVYGDSIPPFTFTYSGGFVSPDTAAVIDTPPTCSAGPGPFIVANSPYTISCSGGSDNNYSFSYNNTGKLTVTRRQAPVAYIGQTVFFTSGSSSTSAQVTLTASVQDSTGSSGNVSNGTVTFTDVLQNKVLASNVKVTPVAGSNGLTGTANTIVTLSTGQYGAQEYLIEVTLNGSYTNTQQLPPPNGTATVGSAPYNAAHAAVSVLIPPVTNTMQGAASIPTAGFAPAGVYRGAIGPSYTAGLKYNKGGSNPQGQIQLVLPQPDGSVVYVKSNSLTSIGFVSNSDGTKDLTAYTKASLYSIKAGVTTSLDGNVSLRMDAHEGCKTGATTGCSGSAGDTIGFTVLSSKDSTLYYSNNWMYDTNVLAWKTVAEAVTPGSCAVVIN